MTVYLSRDPAVDFVLLDDIVYLDPATGAILQIEGTRRWSGAERIAMASYSIHFGNFFGGCSKMVSTVLGLGACCAGGEWMSDVVESLGQ